MQIFIQSGGNIVYRVNSGDSNVFQEIINGVISNNTWYNITATFENTTSGAYKLYLNNSLIASGNSSQTGSISFASTGLYLGHYNQTFSRFDGSIDQVRIFNRALRPYEVEALYTEEYCTPTIVPSEHFNTVLYTGTNASQDISVGFTPDLVWIKGRTYSDFHALTDSVRGDKKWLGSNVTNSEYDYTSFTAGISFIEGGFNNDGPDGSAIFNKSGEEYVSWNFKAGGAAVTNTDGTITSQVSVNTEAGFSVVTHAGPTGEFSVGHGLGTKPSIVITKGRLAAGDWTVYFTFLDGSLDFMRLNQTSAKEDSSRTIWTDEVFYTTTEDSVAYCFAEVEGFSSFGSYVGTGASGNAIVTGFEPAFVMVKRSSGTGNWEMFDNKRDVENPRNKVLFANEAVAEQDLTSYEPKVIDFVENGFVIQDDASAFTGGTNFNISGSTYIYMAFAADPTTIEPSLEDSFNTVLYTSTGGSQSITGLGFQPDLLWTKNRTSTWFHQIVDSVRLAPNTIYSNSTQAESTPVSYTSSLDTDGFTVNYTETIGSNYVAWAWKGAEIPAINSNGSIPSVVSANPAAGFSIVSTKSNGSGYLNFGHGLDSAPELVITKFTSQAGEWYTYTSAIANGFDVALKLNGSDAAITAYGADKWSSTDSVVGVGNSQWYFTANVPFIAYCFAEVTGFSKFGSYTGTGSAGNTVTLGFEPAFVMVKRTDSTGGWLIADNKRDATNPITEFLSADTSQAEFAISNGIDFNANDFTIDSTNGSFNANGGTYIYMAFANQF